ncbi:cysteine desulfurase family protein [Rosistilla oblonga]|uniref:cysteine desulfurase family protein n=1 Tax=Rosistilla oblonga TaxID=2527990 RepID=UPI003A96C1D5
MIYLDNNATTAITPEVLDAMRADWMLGPANPSAQHRIGRSAKLRLEDACDAMLDCLSASEHRFLLTSGGTEANNWVIGNLGQGDGPIIVSQIEHPSILAAARAAEARGIPVRYLPVDANGIVDLPLLQTWLAETPKPRLVSIMAANNETGVIQTIAPLAACCNDAGVPFHSDLSQMLGKLPVDIDQMGITAATIAAHKFHGPVGVGGLILRRNAPISPLLVGGAQQLEHRAGTEPTALVVGMMTAIQQCLNDLSTTQTAMRQRRDALETGLRQQIPDLVVHSAAVDRLPQTTCFSIPHIDRQALLMRLDFESVACSTGSACASGSSEPSHVLQAMGADSSLLSSSIRLSGSIFTTDSEIDTAVSRIVRCCNKLRNYQDVEK